MEWDRIRTGMKFTRQQTNALPACKGVVVYSSDVFKIVRTTEGKEMSVSKSGQDFSLYKFTVPMENK